MVASFVCISGLAYAAAPAAGGLSFSKHGVVVRSLSSEAISDLGAASITVQEPYEDEPVSFRGVPLRDVLDAAYGAAWRSEEEVLFTCSDGYQPTVPVRRILQHEPWLVFDRTDQEAFTIQKSESGETKTVPLGPYYVVWENLDDEVIRQERDYGWPYQVVAIDLIRAREKFPKMIPPASSSAAVRRGFEAFRVHCSKCHQVNGEGGTIGPELNPGGAGGEYYDRAFLRTWIEEPARIRPKTRMPPLNPDLPNRQAVVDDLIAYLFAMAGASPGEGG